MIANINPSSTDPTCEPLWQLARGERHHPLLAHHGVRRQAGDRVAGKAASVFENTKFFLANFLEPFVDLFAWASSSATRDCAW